MNSLLHADFPRTAGNVFKKIRLLKATKILGAVLPWMGIVLFTICTSWQQAAAQIALRGSATSAISTTASVTINKPTGVVAGDVMIANIGNYIQATQSSATCTGWTLIAGTDVDRGRATLLYKIAGASEPATYTFTVTNSSSAATGSIVAFSGVSNTNPFDVTNPTSWTTTSNEIISSIPSITTVTANAAVVVFGNCSRITSLASTNFTSWTITSPSPLTEIMDAGRDGNTNNTAAVGAAWAIKSTAGATGNAGFRCTPNTNPRTMGGIMIALRPCVTANAGSALTAICQGGTSAALGGSVGGSATGGTYSDGGAGGSFSPGATTLDATYTPASSFTGTVTLTLTTSGGSCGVATASKTLVVNPSVVASVSIASSDADNTICAASSVTFTATPTNGGTASYLWKLNSGFVGTNSPTYTTTALANNDVVSVIMTSSAACVSGSPATSISITTTVNALPTAPTGTAGSRCGTGTVGLSATPGSGETIDWYAAASGGAVLTGGTGVTSFTTPSISTTTTYHAQARNTTTGCVSSTRTAVAATINAIPAAPSAPVNGENCGAGTITLSATAAANSTIDWYDATTAGNLMTGGTGVTSFTTPSISTTTTYYAQSRNTTTGCTSTSRTSVVANIRQLTISDQSSSSTYGTATTYTVVQSGATSFSATGLPSGYSINATTGVLTVTANAIAGTHTILVTAGNSACGSTTITLTYTRDIKALTITANNQVKCYGNAFNIGTTSFTSSGLASGDAITSVTLTSDGTDILADPGTYPIVPSAATGASFNTSNYNITYTNGTLTVSDIPSFSVNPSTSTQSVCLNQTAAPLSVTASAGSGTISNYQWYRNTVSSSFGGTLISGATSNSYTPSTATAGVFYYYCVVTNSFGCSLPSSASGSVTIYALPTVVSVTGGGTVCNNTSLTASNGSSGTIYYQGTTSGGISTATPSTSQLISVSGTYYFRAQSAEGCWGPEGNAAVIIQAPVVTGVEICQGGASSAMSTSFSCPTNTGLTTGAKEATSGTNATGVGTLAWTNPGNIAAASTAGMSVGSNITTNYLKGTGYSFNIPSYATIVGIQVTINRSTSGTTSPLLRDNVVSLVKGDVVQATNKAVTGTNWPGSLTSANYGGTADLWGTTWTAADINNANFGVVLSASNSNTNSTRTASVDFMRITVTYSTIGSLNWYTVSSGGSIISTGSSFDPTLVSGSGISNTNTPGSLTYYVECSLNPGCRGSGDFIINTLPNTPTTVNASRCDSGTVTLSATPAIGETIDWYAAASGGSALLTSSNSYTTPSISATTVYYAQARDTAKGCLSARAAATATVNLSTSTSSTVSVCDSYSWNGNNYTSSGTYSYQTTNAAGCDSTAILNLTITASTNNSTTASVCDTYTWAANSQAYTTSGNYTFANGCHTEYLNLTITASTYDTTTASVCDSYTWSVNSQVYTSSGTYSVVSGCHTDYLYLTVNTTTNDTTNVTTCGSYQWPVNGQTYSSSGTYSFISGCAISVLNLTLTNVSVTTNTSSITNCEEYYWAINGQTYTTSGSYTSISNCVEEILNLTINKTDTTQISQTACVSYVWYGNTYTSSGDYSEDLNAANGCDSVVVLHLIINPLPSTPGSISGITEVCSTIGSSTPTMYSIVPVSGAATYTWTVPTGATIVSGHNTSEIGVTFASNLATTNQRIIVTAVSASGCQSSTSSSITLTKTVPGIPTISGPSNACPLMGTTTNAVYTCDSMANASTYTWTVPNNATLVSGQGTRSIEVRYGNNFNIGIITVAAVSNCGNRSPRSFAVIRLTPTAPAAINGPTTVCSYIGNGQQVTYSVTPVANATGYTWTVPNNATLVSGQGTNSIVVTFAANYSTSNFKVKSVSNCFTSGDRQLQISAATYAGPGSITGPTNACYFVDNDASARYSIKKVANVPSYIWTVPAGVTVLSHPGGTGANDTAIIVSFNSNFVFGSQILVQTAGCGASAPRAITITGTLTSMPGVISGPTNVCEFLVSASNPNGNIATYKIPKSSTASYYSWTAPANGTIISHPGGTGENDTIVEVKFSDLFINGTLKVKSGNSCGVSSDRTLSISRLNPSTPSVFDVVQISDCPSRIYSYSVSSMPMNASSIAWTVPTGATILSGQGTTSIVVSYSPSISVGYVTAQGINNCSSSSIRSRQIKLPACATTFTSTAPTNKVGGEIVADEIGLSVFPNPTTTSFNIRLKTSLRIPVTVKVMDIQGRFVKSYVMNDASQFSFGNDLKPGSYLIEFIQGDKKKVQRLMKF